MLVSVTFWAANTPNPCRRANTIFMSNSHATTFFSWLYGIYLRRSLIWREHPMHWELGTCTRSMDLRRCSAAQSCAKTPKRQDQQRQWWYRFIAVARSSCITRSTQTRTQGNCSCIEYFCFLSSISLSKFQENAQRVAHANFAISSSMLKLSFKNVWIDMGRCSGGWFLDTTKRVRSGLSRWTRSTYVMSPSS